MLSVAEAQARILADLVPTGPELVPLADSWGRIAATDIFARLDNPPADVSSMDGYAVRAADCMPDSILSLVGESPAGHPFSGQVGPGETVRIYTGSLVPDGADAILIQENAHEDQKAVTVTVPPASGQYIRRRGQDFAQGQIVVPAGRALTARDIGLAAAANHAWVPVHRRPVVAILSTGDEIALPGEPIAPGGIANSNTPMLAALVRACGGIPVMLPSARDTTSDIARLAQGIETADLLLTAGGASVGRYDLVQQGLEQIGLSVDFWKIAMRPGKPLMHGRIGRVPVLGLPGNPVAALVCGLVFALPAIRTLAGHTTPHLPEDLASLGGDLPENDRRADYLRATLSRAPDGGLIATAFSRQDSAMLHILARSEALIMRPPHASPARAGEPCRIIRLDTLSI
ncbi:molybdopterin molybdenumtransferase MoeA [Gluconacetobacter liquefaciens]|uniref:Molybdopterin molybdenumtransferase n=1 Tax=Gluconacetobacter liquefaciens TaxID=89584 RepID=A0A370G013_GLULI|nr:gephyrin-like molybdotransferase Glp [Gluconacetobacter liquefaciens]MBB2187664.1 molybdopterin molybdotransferase MoeA [Gluconacetobacter liquefaciens]RDI36560.1 molybdopterin molybdochelatase [Gluconacetobacter liquefaciens]GBR01672.1 molybdopterin biosynthesis protein MoeA [Gluconacetobacter liquefaciens NRIC 0522]GEB37512.1 molybdopterin molybdenumtransferase MoeA [Gluconacetobacter liquefaciens]